VIGLGQAEARDHKGLLHEGEVAMRPVRIITAVIFAAAVAVTGCAAHSTTAHSTTVDPTNVPTPTVVAPRGPIEPISPVNHRDELVASPPRVPDRPRALHFATPEGAMRYLAAAYNRNDLAALMHVTTPAARHNLLFMRSTADNLQLVGCSANAGRGDYLCGFTHGFPAAMHQSGTGHAHFTVAPADRVGWYMTVLNDCS
jgi:hypothetical protein